jgi:hypothetical protein
MKPLAKAFDRAEETQGPQFETGAVVFGILADESGEVVDPRVELSRVQDRIDIGGLGGGLGGGCGCPKKDGKEGCGARHEKVDWVKGCCDKGKP